MKPERLIVALDIDGVVCDLHGPLIKRINHEHKLDLRVEDIRHWDWEFEDKDGNERAFKKEVQAALADYAFSLNLPAIEKSREVVRTLLDEGVNVLFLTSRNDSTVDVTKAWIIRNFGFLEVIHSKNGKAEPYYDMLVDDRPKFLENFDRVRKRNAFGVLFDRPWNRSYEITKAQRITRINDWPSLGNLILAINQMDNFWRGEDKW